MKNEDRHTESTHDTRTDRHTGHKMALDLQIIENIEPVCKKSFLIFSFLRFLFAYIDNVHDQDS